MAKFLYAGVSSSNEEVKGEIAAGTRDEAISLLRKRRIRVTSIKKKPGEFVIPGLGGGASLADVGRFTRQFSAMTSAGLPLVQCMDILAAQSENKSIAAAAKQVCSDIQGGNSLSEGLSKHKKIFNGLYCNMVAAGEAAGNLDEVLLKLADYQEKQNRLIRKIKGAMSYPIILLCITFGATGLMLTFVVPQFAAMFEGAGGSLPMPTKIVMMLSDFLQNFILLIIMGIVGTVIGLSRWHETEKGALILDRIMLNIPVLGDLQRKSAIARFSSTFATLMSSGVGIITAMQITAKTSGNKVLEKGINTAIEKISGGQTISEPLEATRLFPPMVIHMIAVGEKTGDIAGMLEKVSAFYEEEVDAAVDALTSILEPLMIVVMGGLIGGILIAMYLPMFDMIGTIG